MGQLSYGFHDQLVLPRPSVASYSVHAQDRDDLILAEFALPLFRIQASWPHTLFRNRSFQWCFKGDYTTTSKPEEMESQARPMSLGQLSPEALIDMCVNGDVAAWEEFMRRYHRLIAGVVFRTTQKWGEASLLTLDDLIQETYLKLCADDYRLLRAYDPKHPDAIYGYLKAITANVVHDRFKALHTEKRGGDQIVEELTTLEHRSDAVKAFGSQHAMEREILLREIDAHLDASLSGATADRDRTIFWLYYRQGFTTKAIASLPAIGLTMKGVESTIFRITRIVRTRMVQVGFVNPDG